MKKLFIIVSMLFVLVGCGGKKDNRVKLDYESMPTMEDSSSYLYQKYSLLSYELDSTAEYDVKINNKDSFLLFVYENVCYGCNLLAPALEPYITNNNVVLYTMPLSKISDKHDLYKAGVNTTPFLVIVSKGKVAYKELIDLPQDKKEHISWVEKWMEKHIEWSEN